MNLTNVIFDLDGTVDSVVGIDSVDKRGYTLSISGLRALIGHLRSRMVLDGVSAATSIVVGHTLEDVEAASEIGMPAAILATSYGKLPHAAPRSPCLFGALDELGSIFARVGGAA